MDDDTTGIRFRLLTSLTPRWPPRDLFAPSLTPKLFLSLSTLSSSSSDPYGVRPDGRARGSRP